MYDFRYIIRLDFFELLQDFVFLSRLHLCLRIFARDMV